MDVVNRLVTLRQHAWARQLLAIQGVEIPAGVRIGAGFQLMHRGFGTVVHPDTVIGDNVIVFHGVTLGRMDAWLPREESRMKGFEISDGAVLCAGAKILCNEGTLKVGRGTVVAANAVLTRSTGENEIWAGVPARKVSDRT
ncbi:hypothetical protein [Kocuria rosea]|uniref:serine O-acetyltransferase n=1 Tax=Kocuria rosea TaxID=1275 RepID=UPI0030169694